MWGSDDDAAKAYNEKNYADAFAKTKEFETLPMYSDKIAKLNRVYKLLGYRTGHIVKKLLAESGLTINTRELSLSDYYLQNKVDIPVATVNLSPDYDFNGSAHFDMPYAIETKPYSYEYNSNTPTENTAIVLNATFNFSLAYKSVEVLNDGTIKSNTKFVTGAPIFNTYHEIGLKLFTDLVADICAEVDKNITFEIKPGNGYNKIFNLKLILN